MKALKRTLISLLVVVLLVGGALLGGYFYVKSQFGIDLINTAKELKILSEPVNEAELCSHAFSKEDMVDVQALVNQSVENFITYTEEQGYIVNFDNLPDEMKYIIRLSDKQVGAIADTVITQESGSSVQLGEESLSVALKQVKFSEITDTGALLNTIIAIDLTTLINQIEGFPYSLFKDKLPNMLYISSIVQIKKGEKAFSYTVLHNSLTINNLNSEESEDLLKTLDILLKIGTAESFNIALGTEIANALIGNDQCNGIAYSLKEIGATDYAFVEIDGVGCFSVLR